MLLNPGDLCLVPDPGYPDYWSGVSLSGRDGFMPLKEANDFLPDYSAIARGLTERRQADVHQLPQQSDWRGGNA